MFRKIRLKILKYWYMYVYKAIEEKKMCYWESERMKNKFCIEISLPLSLSTTLFSTTNYLLDSFYFEKINKVYFSWASVLGMAYAIVKTKISVLLVSLFFFWTTFFTEFFVLKYMQKFYYAYLLCFSQHFWWMWAIS